MRHEHLPLHRDDLPVHPAQDEIEVFEEAGIDVGMLDRDDLLAQLEDEALEEEEALYEELVEERLTPPA